LKSRRFRKDTPLVLSGSQGEIKNHGIYKRPVKKNAYFDRKDSELI
jgi:hypothetical protein